MTEPLTIAIVGSRGYPRMDLVRACVGRLYARTSLLIPVTILSGTEPTQGLPFTDDERGVDQEAIRWARHCGLPTQVIPADWAQYGKMAGPLRNTQIVNACHHLIAFWDLDSRGTADAIRKAIAQAKLARVVSPEGETLSLSTLSSLLGVTRQGAVQKI